jgi:inorganic pyrophosphatase/exopolyphosphatase
LNACSIDLLLTAIMSNTLYFKAHITHQRDIHAYTSLRKISTLPDNRAEIYFSACEKWIYNDPKKAIINDTKIMNIM